MKMSLLSPVILIMGFMTLACTRQDAGVEELSKSISPAPHSQGTREGFIGNLSPQEALKTFTLEEGFEIELVVSEPSVMDPVALAFDEDGRMYVVEMGDYPREAPGGSVKLLEDTGGDGTFDRVTVFAENFRIQLASCLSKGACS